MFEIDPPRDREQLIAALDRLHGEITRALGELTLEVFLAPQGEHWSPGDHLRHLNKSMRPVARAMNFSKVMLFGIGGISWSGSRSFEEVRSSYHQLLAGGAEAGRFSPRARQGDLDDSAWRQRVLAHWQANGQALQDAISGWPDRALDRYRLPHPLLGRLTVREMLYFTLYHSAHHARRIFERLDSSN